MNLRRKLLALLATQKKEAEYTELAFLESTGTQWIDTGIIPLIGDEIELKNVQCVKKSEFQTVFSAGTGHYQTILLVNSTYSSVGAFFKYFATGGAQSISLNLLEKPTTIRVDGDGNIYYNDKFIVQSPPIKETNSSLRLFYRANNSSPLIGKIGAVNIKRDGKFIIDLIPVLDKDLVPCMYDKVSGKYLYNQGDGEFKWKLPNQLEYIGNEENCFVSVPLETKSLDIVEIEQEVQYTDASFNQAEIKNGHPYFFMGISSNLKWYAGTGNWGNSEVDADTEWHTMRLVSYGEENGFWLDGERIYKGTGYNSSYLPYGFELWKCLNSTNYRAVNRKKYVKVTVNGKIEYYLIPVLDSLGTPCMYDLVSKQYFYNQGIGTFNYGEIE